MKKSRTKFSRRIGFSCAALLAGGTSAAFAQTSGTLTGTTTTYNYSTAPWVITSGTGTYPDGGGVATFNSSLGATPGTLGAADTVTIDVSPTLSGITYNDPFSTTLAAGTGTSIIAAATGLTLDAVLTATNSPTNFFTNFNTISAPISGGGTAGVTKTDGGIVTLTGANTYTGGTHINGGYLVVAGTAANGDAVLGATGAGNGLSFNGGTLFTNVTGGLTTSRNIFLDTNGGTIENDTAFTVNGIVSGTGSLSINGFGAVATTLTAANTYTGATITSLSTASALTLSGNGSIATSSSYDLSGTLTLDNSGTTGIDRLNDTGAITTRGAIITTTGNATTTSVENAGALTLADGVTTISVTPGTAGSKLAFANIARQNGSVLYVNGTSLGATAGAGVATVTAGTSASGGTPTLIGGGGAAGTTTISVVPWAYGSTTANTAATATATLATTLVTYDPTNGFRPLATTEYATALGVHTTDNVRLTAATAVAAGGVTANALLLAPSAASATLSGGTLTVTSGAVLYSPTKSATDTISAGLNFGTAEGVITNTSGLTVSGAISGSGGLTLNSPSASTLTISGANTYTGTTTILAGQVAYSGTVAADGATAGAFGLDTSAVVLNAGLGYALLNATATSTFNRNLLVAGAASPGLDYFGSTGTYAVTMNGNIDVEHGLTVVGGASATGSLALNGTISGPGGLVGFGSGYFVTINGNNTFSGGVNAQGDTFIAGSDTAFGTGTIYTSAASTFQGTGTVARTLANNFVFLATPTFAGTAPLTLTGTMNLNGARTIAVSDTAGVTISGVVSNGSLTKTNANGTLFLNSATGNTYTGGTVLGGNVNALVVNNTSGSGTGTGAVSIGATSATAFSALAGNFTISGNTSIAGRLSPGNSGTTAATAGVGAIGTANFGGTLLLSSATTSSLYLDIVSAPGTTGSNDKVNVTGALTLAGTVYFATTGYTLQRGDAFDFVDAASESGAVTFNTGSATFAPDTTGSGLYFDTSRFLIDGTVTVVPEPATVLGGVFTAALLGLGLRRRLRTVRPA